MQQKKFRISIINDFKNSLSFIDYKEYGTLQIWDARKVKGTHRGYQTSEDNIGIFLNYNLIKTVKTKEEAEQLVKELLKQSPVNLLEFLDYLIPID